MQYVNDDMDELFRRAAKDYPLNTGGADWEKVQQALEQPPAGEERPGGKDNRRHLLWLLLLLPLPWICTRYFGEGGKTIADAPAAAHKVTHAAKGQAPVPTVQEKPAVPASSLYKTPVASAPVYETTAPIQLHTTAYKSPANTKSPITVQQIKERDGETVMNRTEQESVAVMSTEKAQAVTQADGPVASADTKEVVPAAAKDSVDTTAAAAPVIKKEPSPRKQRFYAGVIGGVDMTSVEMQKVKKVGYDLGIVAGYAINAKWGIEAGLLSSEKAYYSTGEHLYKAYLLPGTKLREAEGDCRMWEVPLVVRHRFTPEKKSSWTVSAGSSSYFMKEESYDYTYYYITTGQEEKRSRSYSSDSRHLFAAAQLAGGYSRRVGKTLEWRIEPYLKLPLRKVGYYELPLTSFGVHAGITKNLR